MLIKHLDRIVLLALTTLVTDIIAELPLPLYPHVRHDTEHSISKLLYNVVVSYQLLKKRFQLWKKTRSQIKKRDRYSVFQSVFRLHVGVN